MSNVVVTLGDFAFTNFEVPTKMPLGGDQHIKQHDLPGGTRIIDALGYFNAPIEWNGLFFGIDSVSRAKYLETLAAIGNPLSLKWDEFSYDVLIESFKYDFMRVNQIPYTMKCVILKNNANPVTTLTVIEDTDTSISDFIVAMEQYVAEIDVTDDTTEPPVATTVTKTNALLSALRAVNSFIRATVATINNIKGMIKDIQNTITQQIASISNFAQTITTLGGILPNNSLSNSIAKMSSTVASVNNRVQLMNLSNTLKIMDRNLTTVKTAGVTDSSSIMIKDTRIQLPATETVQNTSLYALASKYYQDATKWTVIAQENGLTSPYITQAITLRIPVNKKGSGGLINA